MGRMNWKRVKNTVRGWRIGDFIRQLAIVVLGIVITFWGSDAISDYKKKKEVRSVMLLVKEELIQNRELFNDLVEQWRKERHISLMLTDNGFQYQNIPIDTLEKYKSVITDIRNYSLSTDALDVLKGSGLLQSVPDKNLVLQLNKTYMTLRGFESSIATLGNKKMKMFEAADRYDIDESDGKLIDSGDCLALYKVYLSLPETKGYIRTVPGFFYGDPFPKIDAMIQETIQAIEQKYE